MSRGLIDYMTWAYTFLHKGRGVLRADEVKAIGAGAKTVARTAPAVLANEEQADLQTALSEAQLIEQHIEESISWLLTLENN